MMINQFTVGGGEIKNILNFEKNFKNTKIIKLEQITGLLKIFYLQHLL